MSTQYPAEVVGGSSTLGYTTTSIVEYLVSGHLRRFLPPDYRRSQTLDSFEAQDPVCVYGWVRRDIADDLREADHQVVAVGVNAEASVRMGPEGRVCIRGDGASTEETRR